MMSYARWAEINGAIVLAILLFHGLCVTEKPPNYSFIHQAYEAPLVSYYDYIIIGGGTAACPLAATLSSNYSVLVLERGASPYGNPNITYLANLGVPLTDNSMSSPAQQFTSEDGVANSRARALGGGTTINAGFYSRAEAETVRDAGWDQKLVNESFEWVEKVVVFEPKVGPWQAALKAGLLEAGVVPDNGFTYDHLVGTKIGGTIFDGNGIRHTAVDLFQYANPNRLTVFVHALVQKILFVTNGLKGDQSWPIARAVVYKDASGIEHIAYLKGGMKDEIILAAGTLASPQLLMLSGIGPKDQLQAHNIPIILEQPMVGQGMADNPLNGLFVPSPTPVELSSTETVGITQFGSYVEGLSGFNFYGGTAANYGGFDPKVGGLISEKVNGPFSSGYLQLRNLNPDDNPIMRFNYFKEHADLEKCIKGMETILSILETKAFSKFMYNNLTAQDILNITVMLQRSLPKHDNTNTSLPQFCKDTVRTIWHYHGGCQVGKVVDHDYKVLGVKGLRVIDSSTFLKSPGTNPQATVMMLGRYMGVTILKERSGGDE